MNPMRSIKIEKVTMNIGVGEPGDKLDKAVKLLNTVTGSKPVRTRSMKRIPTWNVRPKLNIACKVTLRGKKAETVLRKLLEAVDNVVPENKFDDFGNFSFGISEYIDIPGIEYDVDVGIIGLEAAVTLERPGYRIKKRRLRAVKVPARHRISKKEAMEFMAKNFNVAFEEEEE